ncbi:F510_1955 family glycosylhydrolase [Nocardioides sp.]|uniref:F510_1955 family glycosylhydrolase n=1 Tax=Nocardioides sp. TaxID=35761 RepID=UPI002B274FB2|nr:exo-alpha-sialidase [Nocardioides sp.]
MRRSAIAGCAAVLALLSGCGNDGASGDGAAPGAGGAVDVSHVHGMGVDPADPDRVLIATHTGLVAYANGELTKVGDLTTDLMGFTVGPDGRLFASGHPGHDEEGPMALGLITSTDRGQTWRSVSLAGEADFHALDAWSGGVVGYDGALGALQVSDDAGATWVEGASGTDAYDLAADDSAIVATTDGGPEVSRDAGRSFTALPSAPLLQLVDFSDDGTLVGVAPDGAVHASDDLVEWDRRGVAGRTQVQALTTGPGDDVWVATTESLQHSTDGGATFFAVASW